MPEAGSGSVQLLTVDSDLARDLDQRRAREAAQRLYVRAIEIPRGRWSPLDTVPQSSRPIGLLMLDGMLVREATVGDHPSAELLGPGDVLRSWDDPDTEDLLPAHDRVDGADRDAPGDHRPGASPSAPRSGRRCSPR